MAIRLGSNAGWNGECLGSGSTAYLAEAVRLLREFQNHFQNRGKLPYIRKIGMVTAGRRR
jgi:hypothetical protein